MTAFLSGKLAQYALVLLITLTLNFLLPRAMPGSPLAYLAGQDLGVMTPQDRERVMRQAGLDKPLVEQYWIYLSNLARGDLGFSFKLNKPVAMVLVDRLPWTLLLTGTALVMATLVGVVFGAVSAWRRGGRLDLGSLGIFIFLESVPGFWLGMILVAVFAVQLGLFPTFGARDVFARLQGLDYWRDIAYRLVLPATTLAAITASGFFLTMRYSMLTVLGDEYITVARAKGLAEGQVLFRHAVRNALLPVATRFLVRLGQAVAGAVTIETVFSYSGVGRLIYDSALARDYPVLQGAFLVLTLSVIAVNLVADLLYPLLDPRVMKRA